MLDGVDSVDWDRLTYANPRPDMPRYLRSLASSDEEEAGQALQEIGECIMHQGTVYQAAAAVVPFLAELAHCAVHHRAEIVSLLGTVADPSHSDTSDPVRQRANPWGDLQATVTAQAGRLVPLLSDPDPDVRTQAAYAVAQCGEAVPADALRQRWAAEDSVSARASLALALGLRDPEGSSAELRSALLDSPHPVRVAAALACVRAGVGWPDGAAAALTEAFEADPDAVAWSWQWPETLLEEIGAGADAEPAADLLGRLITAPVPGVREAAVDALSRRCSVRRSAPRRFVPLLDPLLHDPDDQVRWGAFSAPHKAGAAAAILTDELSQAAAGYPLEAGGHRFTASHAAVNTLVRLGDPRWLDPVCAALEAGHRASKIQVDVLVGLRFSQETLDAVRERLTRSAAAGTDQTNVITALLSYIRQWGADAAAARPEVLAALPLAPQQAAPALAAITVAARAALPRQAGVTQHLRVAALAGDLRCGVAVWRLTGDTAPLVQAVDGRLSAGDTWELDRVLTQAPDAGPALRPLLPALGGYLTRPAADSHKLRNAQISAARIIWLAAGDAGAVAPTVKAVLAAGGVPARSAAELAGLLGEVTLEPALRSVLADRQARVAAARALWRLGVSIADQVPDLIDEIMRYPWGSAMDALRLLADMGAVTALPELTRLADRDERIVSSGRVDAIVWEDERLQRAIRDAVAVLSGRRARPGPERGTVPSLGIDAE